MTRERLIVAWLAAMLLLQAFIALEAYRAAGSAAASAFAAGG
jgi:hypothetical protein